MVMKRYPHELYICDGQTAFLGTSGDWSASEGSYTLVGECREEPNGSGRTVTLNDGTLRQFSSMIYLPVGIIGVDVGAKLYVNSEDGSLRFIGKVLRVSYDRKHSRIWA